MKDLKCAVSRWVSSENATATRRPRSVPWAQCSARALCVASESTTARGSEVEFYRISSLLFTDLFLVSLLSLAGAAYAELLHARFFHFS